MLMSQTAQCLRPVSYTHLDVYKRQIQIFAKFDDLGEEEYGFLKKWDIGDIVEVKGLSLIHI